MCYWRKLGPCCFLTLLGGWCLQAPIRHVNPRGLSYTRTPVHTQTAHLLLGLDVPVMARQHTWQAQSNLSWVVRGRTD